MNVIRYAYVQGSNEAMTLTGNTYPARHFLKSQGFHYVPKDEAKGQKEHVWMISIPDSEYKNVPKFVAVLDWLKYVQGNKIESLISDSTLPGHVELADKAIPLPR